MNTRVATVRHVLDDEGLPVCGQSRGAFRPLADDDEQTLPVCARCQPIARMRGWAL